MDCTKRLWAEINTDRIVDNLRELKRALSGTKSQIMAVVKADAYGHGVLETADVLVRNGVDRLAVSNLDEALQLRRSGNNIPLHILSHTFSDGAEEIVENGFIQTVCEVGLARAISDCSVRRNKTSVVHIKVDTGMTRLGFPCTGQSVKGIRGIFNMAGIRVEGMMTHLAFADHPDPARSYGQLDAFKKFCGELESQGYRIPVKHAANSAALMRFAESHMDMVRPGLALYGLYPAQFLKASGIVLKPAMCLKARVVGIKTVPENEAVGYGGIYRTARESKIITVCAGYADGISRKAAGKARVIVRGEYAPVVGNVCMDHFMADVTENMSTVSLGDEVTIFGKEQGLEVTVDEIAEMRETINYEVVCSLGKRVSRIHTSFKDNG